MRKDVVYKNYWVYIETERGQARNVGLELLAPGKKLAEKQGQKLVAVVIGDGAEKAVREAVAHGADRVIWVDGEEYSRYNTVSHTNALYRLIGKYNPAALLIGATLTGRDLAPRLACRLGTGLTADCTAVDMDMESGCVAWTRPALGGNLLATILCPEARPQIGTVRPGIYKKCTPDTGRSAEILRESISIPDFAARIKLLETIREREDGLVKLEEADIIVSGGLGLGKPENFALLKGLAEALGGAIGASRAAVGVGWFPYNYQIGQTGKTVSPKIYIACGISGAVQHLAGISGSEVIIAINSDPEAPIFDIANYRVVGDLQEILPALTREIRNIKEEQNHACKYGA